MRWFNKLLIQSRMLSLRNRAGDELQDELQFHLDRQIAESIAAGMGSEEGRRAALPDFGNPANLREQARETWSWGWLEVLFRDLRIGLRTLLRSPGFSLVAIAVMALCIGASTSFSPLNGLYFSNRSLSAIRNGW
jgi:hypothetical protein